ncbi:MAG: SNF2 helicase associated domain-containing protein, partial [Defluviitaleaceae bacterium]|nr:SNF2 helicase associated domain-containing protein [Defluviitaleaceae bacterium]
MQNVITKGFILNVSSNADVFARGEKYYKDGKLLAIKSSEEPDGRTLVKASVEGNYKNYEVSLRLEQNGLLKNYTCSCESHNIWHGACKHVVAVLFALNEGKTAQLAPETQRQNARSLTDALERIIFEDIDASLTAPWPSPADPVRLAPCFHYDARGEAFLSFTVGNSKMYVIKNVSAFLANVKREETVNYGNGAKFNHARGMFDAKGQALLEFLFKEESLYAEVAKKLNKQFQYMQSARSNTRAFMLTDRSMDEFFSMYEDEEIDGDIGGPTRLKLVTATPEIKLHITHYTTESKIAADKFNLRVVRGRAWNYMVSATAVYRLPINDVNIFVQLLRAFSASPDSILSFSAGEQIRFLSVIQPKLVKLGVVGSIEGTPPAHTPDDLSVKFYLDGAGNDVTCNIEFHYGQTFFASFDEPDANMLRDTVAEYTAKRRLTALGFRADEGQKAYVMQDNELIYAFLNGGGFNEAGVETLRGVGEVYISETLSNKTIRPKTPSIGIRIQGNLLDIKLEGSGYTFHELYEALEAYRAKKKYYRLKDGRFLPLDGEAVTLVAELMSTMDISRKEIRANALSVPAYRALYLDELVKSKEGKVTRSHDFQSLINQFRESGEARFEIPKSIAKVLREYQKTGYQWLKTLSRYGFGGILADDMGLGKTIQVIAVLLSEQREGIRTLVVAPTSVIYNWEGEIKRFAPKLISAVITGLPEKRRETLNTKADVYITTYDTLKRDIASYEDITFDYIIADEAQNIKNPSTQNARSIKSVKGRIKFALTGTPIENALSELWSIFDFIMPGYLYSAHRFNRIYEYPIVKESDAARASKLRKQIEPFILRRMKKSVLKELPDKTETTLYAELTNEQRKIYAASLLIAKGEFDAALPGGETESNRRMRILAQLT